MKKLKQLLFGGALLVMTALPTAASAQSYSDVPRTHSNYADIQYLLHENVIAPSKTYGVKDTVTREEVAVMVAKAAGLSGATPTNTKFKDVTKANKNSGYIQAAVDAGIINGYEDGTFKPTANVTRGHMAAFIARAFTLPTGTKTFNDVAKNNTAYTAVSQLAAAGITTGYEDGTFKPKNSLSRAHISAFLARAMKFEAGTPLANEMIVHFIDVGQGDATYIELPTGENVLIDAGTDGAGDKVVSYLQKLGVKTLDFVIATHPDADHIGGMVDVLHAFTVKNFVDSGKAHTSQTYMNMLRAIDAENANFIVPQTGDVLTQHEALETSLRVLYANENAADNNDASLVIKGSYCEQDVLLMGDASTAIEQQLVKTANVEAELLKAGHHGSNTSTSASFVKAVQPEAAILSYGKDNSYGHPHADVLKNLQGVDVYSTATSGTIVTTVTCGAIHMAALTFNDATNGDYVVPGAATTFANCTELRKVYANGVKKGHPAYAEKFDADKDGWGCEPKDNGTVTPAPAPKPTPAPAPTTPKPDVNSGTYVIPGAPTSFKNCTAMRNYYPAGVKSSHPAYASKHDRDKDGWACE